MVSSNLFIYDCCFCTNRQIFRSVGCSVISDNWFTQISISSGTTWSSRILALRIAALSEFDKTNRRNGSFIVHFFRGRYNPWRVRASCKLVVPPTWIPDLLTAHSRAMLFVLNLFYLLNEKIHFKVHNLVGSDKLDWCWEEMMGRLKL